MTRTHTMKLNRDDEQETEVTVEYTISPYIPATGPSYSSGGEPAEGGEVEIVGVTVTNPLDRVTVAIKWTDAEDDRWSTYICENHEMFNGDEEYDESDCRYDQMKDEG